MTRDRIPTGFEPSPLPVRTARALWWLTWAALRRMMREGLVVRSMVWPGLVTAGTLVATLGLTAVVQPGRTVVVPPDVDPAIHRALVDADFYVRVHEDPATEVHSGGAPMGTDGKTLWIHGTPSGAQEIEAMLRARAGADWTPVPRRPPSARSEYARGDLVCGVLALLFVLYGLVFGLGGVARDRDDGTLEAELALPVPRWVGGLARWIASTAILATFYALSVALLAAILPTPGLGAVIRNGAAACGGGVAIGLAVVGTAGLKQGFSGPFAVGMSASTALAALGPVLGLTWLPIANLFAGGQGWAACAASVGVGLGAALLYGWRAGVT